MIGRARSTPSGVLDVALLGVLADRSLHGYQLRTRLTEVLGPARSYSFGSLYPALRRLEGATLIATVPRTAGPEPDTPPPTTRRTRVTYQITDRGIEHLATLLADPGPQAWSDEGFRVHLALFGRTPVDARLQVLQGRLRFLEQRREGLRSCLPRTPSEDDDTAELHRLTIQAHDRELLWLRELIARERQRAKQIDDRAPTRQPPPHATVPACATTPPHATAPAADQRLLAGPT